MHHRLMQIVQSLPASKVVLVGDMMLDKYFYGNAERVSPEAPVLVLHYQSEELRLGGAANVASMLATLGAMVKPIGLVGNDAAAEDIRRLMKEAGIDASLLVVAEDRPTTSKLRLVGAAQHRHAQQLMRLDFENAGHVSEVIASKLIAQAEQAIAGCEIVCIEDYNKGAVARARLSGRDRGGETAECTGAGRSGVDRGLLEIFRGDSAEAESVRSGADDGPADRRAGRFPAGGGAIAGATESGSGDPDAGPAWGVSGDPRRRAAMVETLRGRDRCSMRPARETWFWQ